MEESIAYHPMAPRVKPIRFPPLPCPACGTCAPPVLGPGVGPHAGRLSCASCGRWLQWASRSVVQAFLEEKVCSMVGGVNRVILVGTISKYGITVKYATSGTPCASFTLVLSERWSDGKAHPFFVDCECWGKRAEAAGELEAEQVVLFEGRLARRKKGEQWETIVAGYELVPVLVPVSSLTGNSN